MRGKDRQILKLWLRIIISRGMKRHELRAFEAFAAMEIPSGQFPDSGKYQGKKEYGWYPEKMADIGVP